jgi:pyruvyltransferase
VKAYWYNRIVNFGDLLLPSLLRDYGLRPIYSEIQSADIVSIGSILHILPEDFSGYIVGSGLMHDTVRRFSCAKILAVRGELTRERIGAPISTILGDPGLLADRLLRKRQEKKFLMGIVPHYVDKSDERIHNIYQQYKNEIIVIDVQRKPKDVISEIDKCRFIISSSLHGIVVADSLGIPNAWMVLSDKVRGSGFKFFDYASAFGMKYEPNYLSGYENLKDLIKMTHEVCDGIPMIKKELDSVFIKLRKEILTVNRSRFKASESNWCRNSGGRA